MTKNQNAVLLLRYDLYELSYSYSKYHSLLDSEDSEIREFYLLYSIHFFIMRMSFCFNADLCRNL